MSRAKPIVAIDGPSGSGKSTVSKLVAQQLGFVYLDTGAMYRCVGLLARAAASIRSMRMSSNRCWTR